MTKTTAERIAELDEWARDPAIPRDEWAPVTSLVWAAARDRPGLDAVIEWSAAEDAYGDAVKGLPPEQWDGTTRDTPEWTALRAARDRQRAAYSALRALVAARQREGAEE